MSHCGRPGENRQRFTIYVLELADGSYYVGSTAKSVAERVAEHRAEGKRVKKFRRHLSSWCTTREKVERIERETAARLRRKGYSVHQG